ncbi:DUF4097 family beta strand repeat-containing protein [Cohnella sp. REN36]|uniref:DUF4097 family beta strand repeat-containing protein n=1 Tax=Cohnella sp. REN36 TaxID=2887347 RepID=UPI001D143572|nr:DUF4097 family beta strand repeat-containing protein [Cohnella sp. REN36]MCC3373592.1 DUF4097 domain-containing protein [Cohnella sp. REN36]
MKKWIYGALVLFVIGISGMIYTLTITGVNELHSVWSRQLDSGQLIRSVKIHSPDADVFVKPAEQDAVTVDLQVSKGSRSQLYRVEVSADGGQLKVDVKRKDPYKFNIGVLFYRERIEIRIPRKLYESIDITTKLADVKLNGIDGKRTDVRTETGDVRITGYELTGDYAVETTKGDVSIRFESIPVSMQLDFKSAKGKGRVDWTGLQYVKQTDNRIIGQLGSGGQRIQVTTESGGFHLAQTKGEEQ